MNCNNYNKILNKQKHIRDSVYNSISTMLNRVIEFLQRAIWQRCILIVGYIQLYKVIIRDIFWALYIAVEQITAMFVNYSKRQNHITYS